MRRCPGRGRALSLGRFSLGLVPAGLSFRDLSPVHPAGSYSAEDKYKIWMRHRYNDCVGSLAELMGHGAFQVKVGPEPAAEAPVHAGVPCDAEAIFALIFECGWAGRALRHRWCSGSPQLTSLLVAGTQLSQ